MSSYKSICHQPNFKPVDRLFESRLRQFTDTGGQFSSLNLPKFYDLDRSELKCKAWKVPDHEGNTKRPLFYEIDWDSVEWREIGLGFEFGPSWKTWWVTFTVDIPSKWLKDESVVEIEWDSSSEAMIYDHKGIPIQAFTGGGERNLCTLPSKYLKSASQQFYIEVAGNGMFGVEGDGHPDPNRTFRLNKSHLVWPNMDARRLHWDFWILGDAARELPSDSWPKHRSRTIGNEIMNIFDPDNSDSISKGRELATLLLGCDIDSDAVYDKYPLPDSKSIDVFAVGNCHIDTAWLWPFAETRRKILRSWVTQLKLADEYPEYVFVASQMQQFKWLKEAWPKVFAQILEKFETNQFLPIGGSWVENDTNLPNGELLIRQFLLGQRWQFNEFGFYSNIYWLPDTFGYSSQVPQICQQVGISRFLTQKLSWNNINTFPLSTFNWVALDGLQVLVHMPPANTYTAQANFGDVVRTQHQHQNLGDVPASLLLYGNGDGGGGPTDVMLEKLRRCRGLANSTGAIPSVNVGKTVDDFYETILDQSNQGSNLPSWVGEMYLEFHRGTYTTQALVKRYIRYGEVKLHDLEYVASLASVVSEKYEYPAQDILLLWEDMCLCQFHDVAPGSCIGMVYYEEALPMLKRLLVKSQSLFDDAVKTLQNNHAKSSADLTAINTLPWARLNEIKRVSFKKDPQVYALLEKEAPESLNQNEDLLVLVSVDENGRTTFNLSADLEYPASVCQADDRYVLQNGLIKAEFDDCGLLLSLYDLRNNRELIDNTITAETGNDEHQELAGGNQYLLFDDEPLSFPAWDTELYSLKKFKFLGGGKVQVESLHPLESSLKVRHEISEKSWIETVISIQGLTKTAAHSNEAAISFTCTVEWNETYKFLKVQFPTTIHTATVGSYETQFGVTTRPTHFNTSWDVAKFEVAHHKFMDLSGYNYGLLVLNDCKYGGAIHGNLMRLSLLRSPKSPDDMADMGRHHFKYCVFPHNGPLGPDTIKAGYNLNYPLQALIADGDLTIANILGAVQIVAEPGSMLVLSHIKRGENDQGVNSLHSYPLSNHKSLVLRVYEPLGGQTNGTLSFDTDILHVDKVYKTNALEDETDAKTSVQLKSPKNGKVQILLRGFEVATFKVVLK